MGIISDLAFGRTSQSTLLLVWAPCAKIWLMRTNLTLSLASRC